MALAHLIDSLVQVVTSAKEYSGTLKSVYTIDGQTVIEIANPAGNPTILKNWQVISQVHPPVAQNGLDLLLELGRMGFRRAEVAEALNVSPALISSRWMKGRIPEQRVNDLRALRDKYKKESERLNA